MSKKLFFQLACICIIFVSCNAQADTVIYTLENVILSDDTQMTGTFTWTYDAGDFENGIGQFTALDVPHTPHDHTVLNASFDITKSIEITLPGSFHDDGVDITLLLETALTATTSAPINGPDSSYDIGGNSLFVGTFKSGVISPDVIINDRVFKNGFESIAP